MIARRGAVTGRRGAVIGRRAIVFGRCGAVFGRRRAAIGCRAVRRNSPIARYGLAIARIVGATVQTGADIVSLPSSGRQDSPYIKDAPAEAKSWRIPGLMCHAEDVANQPTRRATRRRLRDCHFRLPEEISRHWSPQSPDKVNRSFILVRHVVDGTQERVRHGAAILLFS